MSKGLGNKLRGDVKFNPFNENFDFAYVIQYLKELDSDVEPEEGIIALCSNFFAGYHLEMIEIFNKALGNCKIDSKKFQQILIVLSNRDMYLISQRTKLSLIDKTDFSYDQITNNSFESKIPGFGLVNAQAALEAGIDGLNIILNLLNRNKHINYYETNIDSKILDEVARLLTILNLYVVTKAGFDLAVWEDYYMIYNNSARELKIKCPISGYQIYNRIGEYRLERNIFSCKSIILAGFEENNDFYKLMSVTALKKRNAKRLKSVHFKNGELHYKLASGNEKQGVLKELLGFAELTSYYSFIQNYSLPNLKDVSLYDVLVIFSEVQYLCEKGWDFEKNESNSDNVQNFEKFGFKVSKQVLIEYLLLKTKYNKGQVILALNLFIHEEGYFNVWEKPMIKNDHFLYPVLLPLLNPNKLRLLDYWLERGGFDLDSRGTIFEKHVKETIIQATIRKKYFVKEIQTGKFKIDKKLEEIDLVIEFEDIIIVSEIKCIKFPFNSRDYHNMHKRLTDASKQLKRKINFISSNKLNFSQISFSKKIVPVVITNYPLFSGLVVDDIPITDFSLIENYFINGGMNRSQISSQIKGMFNTYKIEKYYNNEKEFVENMEAFFNKPLPVVEKIDEIVFAETPISVPSSELKIVLDYLNFKTSNVI